MKYSEELNKVLEAMEELKLDREAQQTAYLGLITAQLATMNDELARMNGSVKSSEEQLPKQNDDKIVHVGDEIYSELTNSKAVVHHIDAWNRYECFTDRGSQFIIDKHTFNDYWVKTGKNYPQIREVLKQMQEGE